MTTRRDVIRAGAGLAAILASGKAPANIVKSMLAARGAFLAARRKPKLPYDAELEYLESTGTQYIDTGFKPNPLTTKCEANLIYTANAGTLGLFGARAVNSGNNSAAYLWGNRADWVGNVSTTMSITANTDYHIVCENNVVYVNDTMYTSDIQKENMYLGYSFYLFTFNDVGIPTSRGGQPQKVKSLRLFDNGTLVRDFIPVRVGSVGYMYDKVSGRLFGNAGTGDFVIGPDETST